MRSAIPFETGILMAALVTPMTTHAATGWYAGAAYSRVSGEFVATSYGSAIGYDTQSSETGFKIIGGMRPLPWLAIEANYVDLGNTAGSLGFFCVTSPCPINFTADAHAFSLSTQALYPAGPVEMFARVGVAQWSVDYDWINDDGSRFDARGRSGTGVTWGAGLQATFRGMTTRLEFERFELADDSADAVSLGLIYSFR